MDPGSPFGRPGRLRSWQKSGGYRPPETLRMMPVV